MLKTITTLDQLRVGDQAEITHKYGDVYVGDVVRITKSQISTGASVVFFASNYSFKVNGDYAGEYEWTLKKAIRVLPDVVPGTIASLDFGGQGTDGQRIHPVYEGSSKEPYVWMILQNGDLVKESDLVDFTVQHDKKTRWDDTVPFPADNSKSENA